MKTPHERSVGAAMERRAMRDYLRRKMAPLREPSGRVYAFNEVLGWILARQKRFDAKAGGLGRK